MKAEEAWQQDAGEDADKEEEGRPKDKRCKTSFFSIDSDVDSGILVPAGPQQSFNIASDDAEDVGIPVPSTDEAEANYLLDPGLWKNYVGSGPQPDEGEAPFFANGLLTN